jgi:hypothetical protein
VFSFTQKGDWDPTRRYLERVKRLQLANVLNKYGQMGVNALASATPVESGLTAQSWYFEVTSGGGYHRITWYNSNVNDGVPIAIILQYGHGTGTGGYVAGRDYINPAIKPAFDQIEEAVWREVTK